MAANRALVLQEDNAPTRAEVEAEANALDARMHLAPTEAARRVPGASPRGGRVRAAGGSAASVGNADQLLPLLGSLVEAVRSGVEAYRQAVRTLLACETHANSSQNGLAAPVWGDEASSVPSSDDGDE